MLYWIYQIQKSLNNSIGDRQIDTGETACERGAEGEGAENSQAEGLYLDETLESESTDEAIPAWRGESFRLKTERIEEKSFVRPFFVP